MTTTYALVGHGPGRFTPLLRAENVDQARPLRLACVLGGRVWP